jgi:diguanylate cyclase (GGDEF)-like protein/PAS domain S-box-containing protein
MKNINDNIINRSNLIFAVMIIILISLSFNYFLFFHSLVELFSVITAGIIFVIAFYSHSKIKNHFLIILGIAYGFIGGFDLLHTLSYKGMGIFETRGSDLPTQLWIIARYMESISIVISFLFINKIKKYSFKKVVYFYSVTSLLILLTLYFKVFPSSYLEGEGLTSFKIISEYIISGILIYGLFLLYKNRDYFKENIYNLIFVSIILTILSEISFTFYIDVYGFSNITGHIFKLISVILIFKAIVKTGFMKPYDLLFRELKIKNKKLEDKSVELQEQNHFFSITLNSIGDGVIVTDDNGNIKRLNQKAQKLTKWGIEEAKGKKLSEVFNIINAKTRKNVETPVKKVLEKGEIVGLANHTKLIAKDGTEYHIADSASPIKDGSGNIYGVVLVFRNVTQKYKLRKEIKNKAEILSNAVGEAPFPIMLHNDKGKILEINEVWEKITGYTKEEIATIEDWTEKAYGEKSDSVSEYIKDLHNIDEKKDNGEFVIKTKDGSYRTWDFKAAKIGADEDGNNLVISMAADVTEKNMMEKRIKDLNRIYKTLSSINQVIVKEDSIENLIKKSTKRAVDIGVYDTVWIASINEDRDKIKIESFSGKKWSSISNKNTINIDLNHDNLSIYEKAVKSDNAIIINKESESQLEGECCGSIGAFPLRVFGKLWGLAVFCSKQDNRFNDEEIKLLDELGADISLGLEKIITNQKMLESEKEYRQLFEKSPVGIFKTTSSGKVKLINPAMAEILGCDSIEEAYEYYNNLGKDLYVNPNRRKEFINLLERQGEVRDFIYQAYNKDRNIRWIEMNARISSENYSDDYLIEGFSLDITERKKHQDKVAYMNFHDKLTGLYNRAYIEDMMKRIDTARKLPITMIMADLNNLKFVNDSHGHPKGDEFIKNAARLIQESCRQEDVVARWGGDEFVVLLPNTTQKESEKIMERINEKDISADFEFPISIALGAATKSKSEEDIFDVLNKAEDRMYINKFANRESGRSIVLSSFLNTLKEKSHETESHVNRMTEVAEKFGHHVNLSHKDIDKLSMLSLLHDIGKISVPESILNKTGKLTAEEWEVVKAHPEAGYRILESIPRFSHIAEAVLHHHERWDGSGYPKGLKGKDIPLLARVLTIVDSYDVMVTGRPYQKAMNKVEIIEEFKRCSGTQFDPELVGAFIEMIGND